MLYCLKMIHPRPFSQTHVVPLPCPKNTFVAAPSKNVSAPAGSRVKEKASVPFFIKRHVQPSRVALQAGKFIVMSAVNVPIKYS